MDNGWIKLYRSMTCCKTASRGLNYFGAMSWLVAKASYEETWYDGDKIGRGQLFTGRKYLSKEWKIGQQSVRTILRHLEEDGFLTIKSTSKGSILTICNYDSYQMLPLPNQPSDQPTGNQRVTNDQPTGNHFQEYKEVKEGGSGAPAHTHTCEGYPGSVDAVLAIASDPRCGMVVTREQAEAYFLARDTVDWVDAAGRKISAAKIHGDLRRWMLRENQNGKDGGSSAESEAERMRAEFNRRREEAMQNA